MNKITKKTLIVFSLILSSFAPAHAGGPPFSQAFIFCTAPEGAFGEMQTSDSDFVHEHLNKLGEPILMSRFYMEEGDWQSLQKVGGYSEKGNLDVLNQLQQNCKEDISVLRNDLLTEVKSWIDKFRVDYWQGSFLIIAPYSEENLEIIKKTHFPTQESFPFLVVEVRDDWIFAHTSDHVLDSKRFYVILGLILIITPGFIFFERRSKAIKTNKSL